MERVRAAGLRLLSLVAPAAAFISLAALAGFERIRMLYRRARGRPPRLIWGPTPIISLKYWSEAMGRRGYWSRTCVTHHYPANSRADFDVYRDQILGEGPVSELLRDYAFFAWALRRGDVFLRFLDGGFLRQTPLRWRENLLLRLAGKKLVVSPYGGDIAVAGHLGDLEDLLFADYPALAENSDETKRWVLHTLRFADVAVQHHQPGFMPRYDAILPNIFAIDVEAEGGPPRYSKADGRNAPVIIFHAPNHRNIKGTQHLEAAVAELKRDGLRIDLRIVQGRPNTEIRAALATADIAADQFLSPGYAMFSIEAMAAGRPTLNNLGGLPPQLRATDAIRHCPIVDANPGTLREVLGALIEDPGLRRRIGKASREYATRYHSLEAVGAEWEAIVESAWRGRPLPRHLAPRADPDDLPARLGGLEMFGKRGAVPGEVNHRLPIPGDRAK